MSKNINLIKYSWLLEEVQVSWHSCMVGRQKWRKERIKGQVTNCLVVRSKTGDPFTMPINISEDDIVLNTNNYNSY